MDRESRSLGLAFDNYPKLVLARGLTLRRCCAMRCAAPVGLLVRLLRLGRPRLRRRKARYNRWRTVTGW